MLGSASWLLFQMAGKPLSEFPKATLVGCRCSLILILKMELSRCTLEDSRLPNVIALFVLRASVLLKPYHVQQDWLQILTFCHRIVSTTLILHCSTFVYSITSETSES